jgi:hypothetical protein
LVADNTTRLSEVQRTFDGGVNSGVRPSLIAPNQVSWAINCTNRGGFWKSRPPFVKCNLQFASGYDQSNFQTGYFQGVGSYNATNGSGSSYLVLSLSGRIYAVNVSSGFTVADISIPGDTNNPVLPQAFFQQAENYLIIQDNQSPAMLWNESSMTRSQPGPPLYQVPTGGPMIYHRGRLWVANGSLFYGGDLVGNDPGLGVDSVIYFTENTYLAEGGAFSVRNGPITGMCSVANLDDTLGQGRFLVGTLNSITAFDAPVDRTTWANLQHPIELPALLTQGFVNHDCLTSVNSDVMFRATDGIQSFAVSRREFGQWGNTPLSREVTRAIQNDTPEFQYATQGEYFDNRYLLTCSPHMQQGSGVWWESLAVMNFDGISTLTQKTPPCWEGIWNGLRFMGLQTLGVGPTQRCFAVVLNSSNQIEIWELMRSGHFDNNGTDIPIQSRLELRSFMAERPEELKTLDELDGWFYDFAGTVTVTGYYRSERSRRWNPWTTITRCNTYQDCNIPTNCNPPNQYHTVGASRWGFPVPPSKSDATNGGLTADCYEAQVRLDITGYFELSRVNVYFVKRPQTQRGNETGATCPTLADDACTGSCVQSSYCPTSDYTYIIN